MKCLKILICFVIVLSFILNCNKKNPTNPSELQSDQTKLNMESLQINENFSYRTSEEVDVRVSVFNNIDKPVAGISFSIYADLPDAKGKKIAFSVG